MKIVVVDDSLDNRLLLNAILGSAGYMDVLQAESASETFDLLGIDSSPEGVSGVDLILMDITMPEMDGIEACRRIKSSHLQDVPIIMVTAHTEKERLEKAFAAGAMDYITKPLNKVELLARVRSALALKEEMDQRKLAQIELEEKNRELERASMAKSQILSTASHELKTPLTSILGYVNRLLTQLDTVGPLTERQRKYLETVQRNSNRLKALIDDLLDVSRLESGSLSLNLLDLDVQTEIQEVVNSMHTQFSEHKMCVVPDIPANLPKVKADTLRFSQVMNNLLSNACKYSPNGAITEISARETSGLVQIDVSDNGIGISQADQSKLFTKFFRADNSSTRAVSGTGLGLFVTRCLVEAHGGRMWAESNEGEGSTFSFTLPVATAA